MLCVLYRLAHGVWMCAWMGECQWRYCKALWVKAPYKCSPFTLSMEVGVCVPRSSAFPRRRSCSGWSCRLKTEPEGNEKYINSNEGKMTWLWMVNWYLVGGRLNRPYLCSNHKCHSCQSEWSEASNPPRMWDPVTKRKNSNTIREAGSVDAFKSVLKSFLFSKHYGM